MTATAPNTRICDTCLKAQPITAFRRRARDSEARHSHCGDCHNKRERERRVAKTAARDNRSMARYVSQLKNERSDARVDWICGAMLSHFGGFSGFVEAWGAYIDDARQRGGTALVRALEGVVRLLILSEQNFEAELDTMTLSQLTAMLNAEMRDETD